MTTVHPTAVIDDGAEIGDGTSVWHFCHICRGAVIGLDCVIGQNVMVAPGVRIGDGCKIQNNVSVYQGVTLEDKVFIGPSVVFTNVINPRAFIPRMHELRPTLVKHGASLGANSTIICGVTIGRYALIGAGSVVTRLIPDHVLAYGNPARPAGWICECGTSMAYDYVCAACGKQYRHGVVGMEGLNAERLPTISADEIKRFPEGCP
jgi:UDP-2-acetamido-3-amino-2,3-dideoxy-glucuronate N-acetyltransferase